MPSRRLKPLRGDHLVRAGLPGLCCALPRLRAHADSVWRIAQNFKALDKPNRMAGFRAPTDWQQEVRPTPAGRPCPTGMTGLQAFMLHCRVSEIVHDNAGTGMLCCMLSQQAKQEHSSHVCMVAAAAHILLLPQHSCRAIGRAIGNVFHGACR
jgi:hypothetical protein